MAVRLDLERLESLMRNGEIGEVRRILKKIPTTRIPRVHASRFCNYCRRVGLFGISIRVMNPIVRPTRELSKPATPDELAEYAVALTKVGATREALQILEKIPSDQFHLATLYSAFALFPEWRYAEAVPLIRKFLNSSYSDPYLRTVAEVNLSSALIFIGELEEADSLLRQLTERTAKSGYALLKGNTMELSAQVALLKRNFQRANDLLSESLKMLQNSPIADTLFVKKWTAVSSLYEHGPTEKAVDEIRKAQKEAIDRAHWETARDCDYHLAWMLKSQEVFNYLYHGTPFDSYRSRLTQQLPDLQSPPKSLLWIPGQSSRLDRPGPIADFLSVKTGEGPQVQAALKTGQLMHKLLICLSSDFYRPGRLGSLFSALFPDEYFNPISSPNRIHQLVRRLRRWFRSQNIRLDIIETAGAYAITSTEKYGLLVELPENATALDSLQPSCFYQLQPFFSTIGEAPFTAKEVAESLSVSLSTATRIIREGTENGLLHKIGSGPRTRYVATLPKAS